MILGTFYKQPSEVKDYTISYSDWLADMSDLIDDATATVICLSDPSDTSLSIDSTYKSDASVTVWLSGGTNRRKYKITVQVYTAGRRIDESEFLIVVRDY